MKMLIVHFKNRLGKQETPYFRGATIAALQENNDVLFHNHTGEKLRYAYPLVQYKTMEGKACIVCVNEGAEAIGKLFASCNLNFMIGRRQETMEVESIQANHYSVEVTDTLFSYRIKDWLPLNQESYAKYKSASGLSEQVALLDRILIGNILSFAKGIGVFFEKEVVCRITHLSAPYTTKHKDTKLLGFNAEFECNVSLPEAIGLGKGSSLGRGIVERI